MKALTRILCAVGFLSLGLFLGGCNPPENPPTTNLTLDVCVRNPACTAKLAIAHRGGGSLSIYAPENTIAGFDTAWKMGADAVEMDPRDTLDGVPVLMHDSTVERTTDGTGEVSQMTLAQIKALKIKPTNPSIPVQSVPTFQETMAFLNGKCMAYLDLKSVNIPRVVGIIETEGMIDSAFLLIGSVQEGQEARAANPAVALMPTVANIAEAQAYLDALGTIDLFDVALANDKPDLGAFIHGLGLKIATDGLGIPDFLGKSGWADMLAKGVDLIQTDKPDVLVPYLRGL